MAKNENSSTGEGRHQVIAMDRVLSGDMVLVEEDGLHGVALIDTNAQGNIVIDIAGRWYLPVESGATIEIGDALYCDATGGTLDNDPTHGIFFGYALEGVVTAPTGTTICVLVVQDHVLRKGELLDEFIYNEYLFCSGVFDDETIKLGPVANDCLVVNVSYFTNASPGLGTGAGIEVRDGGTNGNGTGFIDESEANLTGLDNNVLGTPYALSSGDHVNVKFDDFATSTYHCTVKITLEVKLNSVA